MLEHVPAWLGKALRNVRAGHGKLAVARLGSEAALHTDGFVLRSAQPAMQSGPAMKIVHQHHQVRPRSGAVAAEVVAAA